MGDPVAREKVEKQLAESRTYLDTCTAQTERWTAQKLATTGAIAALEALLAPPKPEEPPPPAGNCPAA